MNLLEMDDKELVTKITKDFTKAEQKVDALKPQWEDNYRKYKSKLKNLKEGRANLFIPYTWATVEQLKARALQALFSRPPYINFVGVGKDDVDGSKVMEQLVQYQLKEKINLPFKFIYALNSIFNYGTAIALTQWKKEEKTIKKRKTVLDEQLNITMSEEIVEQVVSVYDDPDVEFYPLDDFFPDPEGEDIKSCAYCCTKVFKDLDYLRAKEKDGIYTLPDGIQDEKSEAISDFRDNVNSISSNQGERNKAYEIISYYTDDYKIVLLNRKYIIQKEENESFTKEKPFQRIVAFPLEKEFYGMSMVEVISKLQDELNATRNQRLDNISLILNSVMLKRRDADIDDDLELYPGKVIEVQNMDDLKPLVFNDVTSSAMMEEEKIKQDIQFVSSVSEYARGATPQRKETATTVTSIQEASNTVFNYIIMVIETSGLIPIANAVKKLNQQYVTEDKIIRLFNAEKGAWEHLNVNPNDIQGDYDVVSASPRMETQATQEARRGQLLEMFNTLTNNDLTKPYINVPSFIKKLMETYDIKDSDSLLQEPMHMMNQNINMPGIENQIPNQMPEMNGGLVNGQTQ